MGSPLEEKVRRLLLFKDSMYKLGTLSVVEFPTNQDYVLKHPFKFPAEQLFERYQQVKEDMESYFIKRNDIPNDTIVIPNMQLVEVREGYNCIKQPKVDDRTLGSLTDQEIESLPIATLESLKYLMECVQDMYTRRYYPKKDFIDVFGVDQHFLGVNTFLIGGIRKRLRSLDVRYSTNIIIGEEDKKVYFIDPDTYYASTQTWFHRMISMMMSGKMLRSVENYHKKLDQMIQI